MGQRWNRVSLVVAMTCLGPAARAQSTHSLAAGVPPPSEPALFRDGPLLVLPDPRLLPRAPSTILNTALERHEGAGFAPALSVPGSRTKHVVIGGIIGALTGMGYVYADNRSCLKREYSEGPPCSFLYLPFLIGFGVGGFVVGGLVGSLLPTSQ